MAVLRCDLIFPCLVLSWWRRRRRQRLRCHFFPFFRSLWGGSVINLGTQKHRDKFLEGIDNLDYPGCFAMTELHHGELPSLFLALRVARETKKTFLNRW